MAKTTYKSDRVRTLVAAGVFIALAYVCCVLFHFKAMFLSFDLKDSIMTIGAMLLGPSYGFAMVLIVSIIEGLTISSTGIYGFIMNVLSSTVFVCLASFIYSRRRTLIGASIGIISSVISMVAVMLAANILITPYYMGAARSEVVALIPTLLLPFNLTKGIFNASLVFLLYKPIATALKRAGFKSQTKSASADGPTVVISSGKKSAFSPIVLIIAAVCGILAMVYFFVFLGGSFTLN